MSHSFDCPDRYTARHQGELAAEYGCGSSSNPYSEDRYRSYGDPPHCEEASREWEEGRRSEERRQEEREEEQRAERRAAEQRQYEQEQQDERYREEEQQAAEARHQEEQENAREQVADKIASELTEKVYDPADLDDDTPYDKYARHDPGTYEGYDPRNPAHHS